MTTTQQPEALVFADDRPTSTSDDLYQWAIDAEDLIRAQHARIAELEDVADMAIKRIAELESQLSAIGAGGVEPLTNAQREKIIEAVDWYNFPQDVIDAVERAHGIKGGQHGTE